ncbi:V-type ATP synthase subunit A, partial [archaeon]|nr:V-type ATP synthase subunit A [archaeon]
MAEKSYIYRIAGPVVIAKNLNARINDLVRVGDEKLMGEVIKIQGDHVTIQVYEETTGLKPGEPVINTEEALSVQLGPGLLYSIYDGIQRPLKVLEDKMGSFIQRGVDADGLDPDKKWEFKATSSAGDVVDPGMIIGEVEEKEGMTHRIMIPPLPGYEGTIKTLKSGKFTVNDVIGTLVNGTEIKLSHRWPVRIPRKVRNKLMPTIPLITGQRIFDALFPLAKGGVAAIPGPFGAGKTVAQQQLAKWCDAEVIVYIGCGERGNE